MKWAVLIFPGTNDDEACLRAVEETLNAEVVRVWHTEAVLDGFDAVILPGGSAYGDYLRPGAIASQSPAADAIRRAAQKGTLIVGIGNGYQVLLEMGLLPGAMLRNDGLRFRSDTVTLKIENNQTPLTLDYEQGEQIRLPIAHKHGNYYCDEATYRQLERENRIFLTYDGHNPNGSLAHIAGIVNEQGNVCGLMPHPERAIHPWMGSVDGRRMWTSLELYWRGTNGA